MQEPNFRFRSITFPGRAGELQRAGASAALVAELGDNYAEYHTFLAAEFGRLDFPTREEARQDMFGALKRADYFQQLVMAEAALRAFRRARRPGGSLSDRPDMTLPLLDEHQRLISAETRVATPGQRKRLAATPENAGPPPESLLRVEQ